MKWEGRKTDEADMLCYDCKEPIVGDVQLRGVIGQPFEYLFVFCQKCAQIRTAEHQNTLENQ